MIYCSHLKRARETAAILFPDQEIIYDSKLSEIDYGMWTHRSKEEVDKVRKNHITQSFERGESYLDMRKRMRLFLNDISAPIITIISHQAPQLALDVICHDLSFEEALLKDWRLIKNGWKPFWIYCYER